ncbi:hypothetical protein CRUP_020321, partial [Coryphaenoides rupestris]
MDTKYLFDLHPPTLGVNGSLLVPLGGSAPLGVSLLRVRDPDSPPESLLLELLRGPTAGYLLLLGGGGGADGRRELLPGDAFTLTQLRHGQPPRVLSLAPLLVDAPGAMATVTKAVLHLDDPDNAADVLVVVLEPPRHGRIARLHGNGELGRFSLDQLGRGQVVYLHDGSSAHADSFLLQAELQGTTPGDIIYSIMPHDGQPKHGEVVLIPMPADGPADSWGPDSSSSFTSFTSTSSFTQQDVNDGAVWYRHFGDGTQRDAFHFQVSTDSSPDLQRDPQVFSIGVLPQGPGVPQLDPDCQLQLTFEVVEEPLYGTLLRSHTPMKTGEVFSFSDVTRNSLQYQHAGLSTQEDAITFSVSDGISMATTVVQVVVLGAGDNGPRKDPAAILSLEVGEKSSTVLRRTQLAYTDNSSPDQQIRIQLISVPMYGILAKGLSPQAHQELAEYSTFTMEDINKQRIRYITSFETGSQPVTDIFHFVVYDGGAAGSRVITPDKPFSLDDLTADLIFYVQEGAGHAQEDIFSFYVSDGHRQTEAFNVEIDIQDGEANAPVVSVSSVVVEENSGVVVTNASLSVRDPDTPLNEILITLDTKPAHGKLRRRQFYSQPLSSGRVLSLGSSFSYQDVLDMLVVYTPDGGGASDQLDFTVTDGVHTRSGTLEFTVTARRSEGPRMTVNRGLQLAAVAKKPKVDSTWTCGGTGFERLVRLLSAGSRVLHSSIRTGSSSKITEQNLKGSDIDSDPLKLSYVLTSDPAAGTLLLNKKKLSVKGLAHSFTQEDVNKGRLQFSHSREETGGSLSFKFNLVDPEGNKLIDQSFFISVL